MKPQAHINRVTGEEIVLYLGFAILVLTVKFAIIGFYGNATPYWDQWDSEADGLYRPWIEGTLQWSDLFVNHNEHRIFPTRLLALLLLEINGRIWDPILQMQVNAVLHVFTLSILLWYLSKSLPSTYRIGLFSFCAILFTIPFGFTNLLQGFQSSFYFFLLFSLVSFWGMAKYNTYTIEWWGGYLCGVISALTLASGSLTIIAGMLVLILRKITVRKGIALSAILLLLITAATLIFFTPSMPHHIPLKAKSVGQFIVAAATAASWPVTKIIIIQLPLAFFMFQVLRDSKYQSPSFFFIFAAGLWLFGQFASLAYGRAVSVTAYRYLDVFAIGLVLNFASLLVLLANAGKQHKWHFAIGTSIWLITIALGFALSGEQLSRDLRTKGKQGIEQEKNVRSYLCDGDILHLQDKQSLHVPYPDPIRLKQLLDNATIRSILPGNIHAPNSLHPIAADGEPFCDPGTLVRPFEVIKSNADDNLKHMASIDAITSNTWQGTDYFKSEIPGYKIIGSFVNSETDTGIITLQLQRGDQILYRSGPRVNKQLLLINGGGPGKFYTYLPRALDWTVLEFSHVSLPVQFDVMFIDGGTKWAEWSAIAIKE